MTSVELYDFESNIPDMIAAAFTAAGLQATTLTTPPDFQKPRPRSELTFRLGPAVTPARIMIISGWGRVIAAYTGDLDITSITDPSESGKQTHAGYRAAVRELMELDRLRTAVNLTSFPYKLDFATPAGGTITVKTEDGYEISRLTYRLEFSIKQDAFTQLATTEAAA